MKYLYKTKLLSILFLSLFFMSQNAIGQTTIFEEDFESATTMSYNYSTSSIGGLPEWSYTDYNGGGRLQFNTESHNGNYAALFDSENSGSNNINYLILTYDMSSYSTTDNIKLNFYFAQFNDETNSNDKVWIRGASYYSWVEIYNLNPASWPANTWHQISDLNISQALINAGQSLTSSFQVRLGQEDNYPYSTDGIAYDDISITKESKLQITDIIHDNYVNYASANDSVGITIQNSFPYNVKDYTINMTIIRPDGYSYSYSMSPTDSILGGTSLTKYFYNIDFSDGGEYQVTAVSSSTMPDIPNSTRTETLDQTPFESPYYENILIHKDWWNTGNGFYWSNYDVQQYYSSPTNDSLITPAFNINTDELLFYYNANGSYLPYGDTVFVQIAEQGGIYYNYDTLYGGYLGYDKPIDLASFNGKNIRVQFRTKITSNSWTHVNISNIRVVPYYYDFNVSDIQFPNASNCGSSQYPIYVQIHNNGNIPQSNTDINIRVYGTIDTTFTATIQETIQKGVYNWYKVGTIDASVDGPYEVIATVIPQIDEDNSNDIRSENISIIAPTPLIIDIQNDFSNYYWDANNFSINSNQLYSYNNYRGDSSSITSFRIGKVTDSAKLFFDYRIYSQNNIFQYGYFMGNKDIINVYVAEDIYGTYDLVASLDSSDYTPASYYQTFPEIDLSNYIGKDIVVKFEIKNGSEMDSTRMIQLYIDNLYIGRPEVDISVTNIFSTLDTWCGDDANQFQVYVSNNSRFDSYNVPLYFEYTPEDGEESKHLMIIDTLPAYSNQWIMLDTLYDMSAQGNYNVTAYTDALYENNTSNDSYNTIYTVNDKKTLPYLEYFNSNPFSEWTNTNFNYSQNSYLFSNSIYYNGSASIISPKFGDITAGSYLTFKYAVNTESAGTYLRDGDTIKVYISNDCGNNWTEVYDISHDDVANSFTWQYITNIDLTAYQGQDLRAKIEFKKQNITGHNIIYIDNFQVVTTGDAGVQTVAFPQHQNNISVCGTTSDSAMVIVKNYGSGSIDNVPVKLNVIFGQDTTFIDAQTGVMQGGGVDTLIMSGFNTEQSGSYSVFAYTYLTDDIDPNNDNSFGTTTIQTQALHTMPYYFDGSYMPSDWMYFVSDANNALWTSSGSELKTPKLDNGDTAYVTTQKVGIIQANDELEIQFSVGNFDQAGNYLSGLFRTNDKLMVQISNDCGVNYTTVATFTSNNYIPSQNGDTVFVYALDNYIGSQISVRIWTEKLSTIGKLDVRFNNINLRPAPMANIAINSVYFEDKICGNMNEPIFAIISNPSLVDITNYNIVTYVKSNNSGIYIDTLEYIYNGLLEAGSIDTIIIGAFDSQLADRYFIETEIFMNGDSYDTYNSNFRIWETEDYNYYTYFSGNADGWKFNGAGYSNSAIYSNEVKVNRSTFAFSPKIESIAPNSLLEFTYNLNSGTFALGDSINVWVSADCGNSYSLIGSVTNANNQSSIPGSSAEMSLAAFSGQDIQFLIEFVNVNDGSYYVYVDNFGIITTDIEALGIVTETDKFVLSNYNPNHSVYNYAERYITCGDATDNLLVVVKNTGSTIIDTINVSIAYTGKATGTLTGTYIGSLLPGAKTAVSINGTIDTETPGLVNMTATTTVDNDAISTNNTIGYSVTTQLEYPLPYSAFSGSHFNENYYWKYDENGNMSKSGSSLNANGLNQGDTAYSISPKIEITNNHSYLFFGYTVSNSLGEGHITNNEYAEVLVSSDCGTTWNSVWYMDVTTTEFGASSMITADLGAYNGQNILFKFRGIKGNSNGLFNINYNNIKVLNSNPAEIEVSYNGVNHASGSIFEEGNNIHIAGNSNNSLGLSYEWMLENSDTSYTLSSSYSFNHYLSLADSGIIILKVKSPTYNNVIATDTYAINVCETPSIELSSNGINYQSGVTFEEGTSIDLSFNSNSDLNLTYEWTIENNGTSTSIGTGTTLNYTLTANDNGDIVLSLINPQTNYVVATAYYSINVFATPEIELVSNNVSHLSGATFVEGTYINLSFNSNSALNLNYNWKIENSSTSYSIGTNTSISNYTLALKDSGNIVLEIINPQLNNVISTATYAIQISETPVIKLFSNSIEYFNGATFEEGTSIDLSFNSNSSLNLNYEWKIENNGLVNSIGTGSTLNHSLGANDNGDIVLYITNPQSGFIVATANYPINVYSTPVIELTSNNVSHLSGATFVEGTYISLSFNSNSTLNLNYNWKIENASTSYSIGTTASLNYTLALKDTGNIILEIMNPLLNNVISTATYAINVSEAPEIVLTFNNENRLSGSYFEQGNTIDLSFNSNSNLNLTYNWEIENNGNYTSIGTGATLNYTLTANDDGNIILSLVNPQSNFVVATATYAITVIETPSIKLFSENIEYSSGATFCEGIDIDLSFNSDNLLNLRYEWKAESNGNSILIGTGASTSRSLLASDDGTIKLYIYSVQFNKLIATDDITINVNPLPSKPTITGNNEVVSNVVFSEYTASGSFANQYIWEISNGGIITGSSSVGSVNWTEGYVGYAMISATGYNVCGMGTTSNDYLVYVDYLDPIIGDDGDKADNTVADTENDEFIINTYPNPNNGRFSLELPIEVEKFEMEIKSNQGILLKRENVIGNKIDINLGHRIPGIYYIQVSTNGNVYSKAFIIY